MNLNVSPRSDGRKYLSIVKAYRDKDTKKPKSKTVLSLGYLDELEKKHADPIAHFREVARKMTEEEKKRKKITLTIDADEKLPEESEGTRNLGYAVPLSVYHELELHRFLKNKARTGKFEFNTNSIMILLTISRILSPGSKKRAFEEKGRYFERFDFSLDDVYRALSHCAEISKDLQRHLHEKAKEKYGGDTSVIYYDVTNYYFETKKQDEMRRYGKAKQNRKKPVVQMGLAADKDGVPLHYELFPGNKLDKETFRSVIGEVRKHYDTGRVVVVCDMGVVTGDNIHYLVGDKPEKPRNGYVLSFSVRGGTKDFKEYVLDETGYTDGSGRPARESGDFKVKSRRIAREINVTTQDGRTKKKTVYEKQVVFWSRKYEDKARAERAELLAKAETLASDPSKYNKATSYGAAAYVEYVEYDENTGEAIVSKKRPALNLAKIKEEEKYDGYYAIVTSELCMSDGEIIDTYKGLWEIEEAFRITKSDLEARPVYVREPDHIEAHFLICFVALTILRLIQKKTGKKHSARAIVDCLGKIVCMNEQENLYLFAYRSKLSDELGDAFGIDFTRKRMTLSEIKNLLGDVKKDVSRRR
jgi:transposase